MATLGGKAARQARVSERRLGNVQRPGARKGAALGRLLAPKHLQRLAFAAKINIFGLGLMALWNSINTIVLSQRVEETAPAALRGSALGLVSLVGIGVAPSLARWWRQGPAPSRRSTGRS